MSGDDKYFRDYFRENDSINSWDFYGEGSNGDIWTFDYSKDDILKILLSFDSATKKKIRDTFVAIDFKGGDINHYLDFILTGYAKMQMGKKL